MWQRVLSVLVIIVGLMMAVLGVVSEDDQVIRLIGAGIMLVGVIWLYFQRSPERQGDGETPPLRWYQSPILWVPVAGVIIFLISLSL